MTQLAPYIWHLDSCPAPAHVAECNCGYAAAKAMAEKVDAGVNETAQSLWNLGMNLRLQNAEALIKGLREERDAAVRERDGMREKAEWMASEWKAENQRKRAEMREGE